MGSDTVYLLNKGKVTTITLPPWPPQKWSVRVLDKPEEDGTVAYYVLHGMPILQPGQCAVIEGIGADDDDLYIDKGL